MLLPDANGPIKQLKPLKRLIIPVALLNFFKPTKSIKYMVVRQFIPAIKTNKPILINFIYAYIDENENTNQFPLPIKQRKQLVTKKHIGGRSRNTKAKYQ